MVINLKYEMERTLYVAKNGTAKVYVPAWVLKALKLGDKDKIMTTFEAMK